jgi:hypothetical protein
VVNSLHYKLSGDVAVAKIWNILALSSCFLNRECSDRSRSHITFITPVRTKRRDVT